MRLVPPSLHRWRATARHAALALIAASAAAGAEITWGGIPGGHWSEAGAWDLRRVPHDGDVVVFRAGFAITTVDDLPGLSLGGLRLGDGVRVEGVIVGIAGTISLDAGSATLALPLRLDSDTTIVSATGASLSIGGTISGDGRLGFAGAGTTTLSGDDTFTGACAIDDGLVVAATTTALGSTAEGTRITNGCLRVLDGAAVAEPLTLAGPGHGVDGAVQAWGVGATTTLTLTLAMPLTVAADTTITAGRDAGAGLRWVVLTSGLVGSSDLRLRPVIEDVAFSIETGSPTYAGDLIAAAGRFGLRFCPPRLVVGGGAAGSAEASVLGPLDETRIELAGGHLDFVPMSGGSAIGGLSGTGSVVIEGGTPITIGRSAAGPAPQFTGTITGGGSLVLQGRWRFDGTADLAAIRLDWGVFEFHGDASATAVSVQGILSGDCRVGALQVGGALAPGDAGAMGTIRCSSLVLGSSAEVAIDVRDAATHDLVVVDGDVTCGGTITATYAAPPEGTPVIVIDHRADGPVHGAFSDSPPTSLTAGDGNDIAIAPLSGLRFAAASASMVAARGSVRLALERVGPAFAGTANVRIEGIDGAASPLPETRFACAGDAPATSIDVGVFPGPVPVGSVFRFGLHVLSGAAVAVAPAEVEVTVVDHDTPSPPPPPSGGGGGGSGGGCGAGAGLAAAALALSLRALAQRR